MRFLLVLAIVLSAPAAARADGFPLTKISKVKVKGGAKTRAITKQLRAVSDYLGLCKANDPALARKHTIGFEIAADGTTRVLQPDAATEPGLCFGKALAHMKFPPADGLMLVVFVATFVPTKSRTPPADLGAVTDTTNAPP